MFNFFVTRDNRHCDRFIIGGDDYNHIKNVLRMGVGDRFLVSCEGISSLCELESFDLNTITAKIIEENYQNTNLPVKIYLFQGLPKSDKMELIIQKAVELGVEKILPVEMKNCVVKLDGKKKAQKQTRWQAISESAAKQSKRSVIPEVCEVLSYGDAMKLASTLDLMLVPYENKEGMAATKEALSLIKSGMTVGILIGPEGGFDGSEIEAAKNIGGKIISLGSRILRTETAAITAAAMCMLHIEMNLNGED